MSIHIITHNLRTSIAQKLVLLLKWWVQTPTSQRCTRSLIGSSTRAIWSGVWRRNLCGCSLTLTERWRSSRAEGGSPEDSHPVGRGKTSVIMLLPKTSLQSFLYISPGGTCRRRGWSWWTPPRVFASHCCSWTFSTGFLRAGSDNTKGIWG